MIINEYGLAFLRLFNQSNDTSAKLDKDETFVQLLRVENSVKSTDEAWYRQYIIYIHASIQHYLFKPVCHLQ